MGKDIGVVAQRIAAHGYHEIIWLDDDRHQSVGVIRFMEGPLAPIPCASESAYRPCDECKDVECCGIRIVMREVRDAVAGILDRTTLQDAVRKVDGARRNRSAVLTYDI